MSESRGREPSEEELAAAMAEQLRQMRVEELVASSLQTLLAVAYQRLGGASLQAEDLGQVQLAIEAIRGLLPVAERFVPPEGLVQFRQALSELQLGYAAAARAAGFEPEPAAGGAAGEPAPGAPGGEPRRRSTIWTPGGEV